MAIYVNKQQTEGAKDQNTLLA